MQLTNVFFSVLAITSAVSAAPTPSNLVVRTPPTLQVDTIHGFPPKDWECKTSQTKDTSMYSLLT
jgi:hypothetical protein